MLKIICFFGWIFALLLSGCSSNSQFIRSASGKNLDLSGYFMLGELESVNTQTASPLGRLLIGRVNYKSRKVAIPSDQKVPTAGYFKATGTQTFFGTREVIIEYDFTAESPAAAAAIQQTMQEQMQNTSPLLMLEK